MKNIHLLPTENSSRLSYNENGVLKLNRLQWRKGTQNIYITSDEEIKEGDWFYRDSGTVSILTKELLEYYESIKDKNIHKIYKIILTTDQDLIKDGVQAIDDEFLEWFVKNPSCEEVKIVNNWDYNNKGFVDHSGYKIIIPKEEPKQETLEEVGMYQQELFNYLYDLGITALQSEMQEIERIVLNMQKEQDNKLYSEEYMLNFAWFLKENLGQYSCDRTAHFEGKYLEQFKNK